MKNFSRWLAFAFFFHVSMEAAVIHEEGAIYLEGLFPKSVKVRLEEPTAIYYQVDMRRLLGELRPRQDLELQAVAGNLFRVRGMARQGQVAGWIHADAVKGLPEKFVETVMKAAERRAQVEELIAKKEVAVGMSVDEVQESVGKPEKKSSRVDGGGHSEVWEYIRYERVPQVVTRYDSFGRLIQDTVYVRMPVGRLAVIFGNGVVEAIEQSEGTTRGGRSSVVIPPLHVY